MEIKRLTPRQIADTILLQLPFGSAEVCDKHFGGCHLHLLCKHGLLIADFEVEWDCITNCQTLEFCFWDADKGIVEPFVFDWVRGYLKNI